MLTIMFRCSMFCLTTCCFLTFNLLLNLSAFASDVESSNSVIYTANEDYLEICQRDDSFKCVEDECIPINHKCNGVAECSNGADESLWECGCLPNEFFCNGTCIDSMLRCDTKSDCLDGTDEDDCETYLCPYTHFKCNNHFCIPGDSVCNFVNDCGDNSDEQNCLHRACWFGEFTCNNGQCIRVALLCDGEVNCLDGSDETHCNKLRDYVQCSDKSLVHRYFWCDEWPDCKDNHADELNCKNCTHHEFRCSNSRCIAKANVCDMICDCADTCEDEKNCQDKYLMMADVPMCSLSSTIFCPKTNRCIHENFICDGRNDCQSGAFGSDEYGCTLVSTCPSDHFRCPDGRCLPLTAKCDFVRDCVGGYDEEDCDFPSCSPHEFRCLNGQCVQEQNRCNTRYDCRDRSDEINCQLHTCPDSYFKCNTGQCIPQEWKCNFRKDCFDGSDEDEDNCELKYRKCQESEFKCNNGQCIPQEAACYDSGNVEEGCADGSHLINCRDWECPSHLHKCLYGNCIPKYLVCNGQVDCWGSWNDEIGCPFKCSSEARCECRDVMINCTNIGLETLPANIEKEISKYIFSGNQLGHNFDAKMFKMLDGVILLDLSNNSILAIPPETFKNLWRLRILNLQDNFIEIIQNGSFFGLLHVATLNLQNNRIKILEPFAFYGLSSLKLLDLSHQQLVNISPNAFQGLRSLLKLNLSYNKIMFILDGSLSGLPQLLSLDLSKNNIQMIGSNCFHGLTSLQHLTTDEFRFCCLARHVNQCFPKADEFSSCEDLMSNLILRICIWVLGLIAFTGNILVIIWRVIYRTNNRVHSFLITNLAIGDMCMGIYMLIIAAVDTRYRGMYFIYDSLWRTSELCQFAGFVSTFSSELSVLTLTVITLDRFVGIAFPFRMKRLKMHHTRVVMTILWLSVTFLAGLPLANLEYFSHFYGRSGVCLALHITNEKPSGWEYSVFIFLALNLLSFSTISAAYLWMFLIARNTQMAVRSPEVKRDNTMARRMSLIVFTDFCCWMPIILLGILSLSGVTIPPQVFAWIAVFVLPLNAAINPVLYTLSTAPFLGPTRKRVSRFRRSFMTSITIDAYRTGTSVVDEPYTDNTQPGRRSVRLCSSARTLGASGTREIVHMKNISDEKGSTKSSKISMKCNVRRLHNH